MEDVWTPAYVAVGSNLDDPLSQVRRGLQALRELPDSRRIAVSRLYRTTPLGPQNQPDFVNAAAGLLTRLAPRNLLAALKSLEVQLGREQPVERWGPRRIDFDLIVFGTVQVHEPDLTVPHPGASQRNFVLYPLLDIAPQLMVPGQGRVAVLAGRVGRAGLTPIE